jgi:hypothetical protein
MQDPTANLFLVTYLNSIVYTKDLIDTAQLLLAETDQATVLVNIIESPAVNPDD